MPTTTVGNRVIARIATLHAPAAYAGSSFVTATLVQDSAEQIAIPFYCAQAALVSAGPELKVYRSTDGGVSFDTIAQPAFAISRASSITDRKTIILDGGIYALVMQAGGPNTATLGLYTGEVITAYVGIA